MHALSKKIASVIERDDLEALLAALPSGVPFHEISAGGEPLPLRLAEAGAMRSFEHLLRACSTGEQALQFLSVKDGMEFRALDWAALCAGPDLTALILSKAPQLAAAVDSDGESPLMRSLKMAHWESAKLWLAAHPDAAKGITFYGRSVLHLIAEPSFEWVRAELGEWPRPPEDLIDSLIRFGADPSHRNPKGYTALSRALNQGNDRVVNALLQWAAAHPESSSSLLARKQTSFSTLHEAAWLGRSDLIPRLVALGSDLDEVNGRENTPLHLALRRGHLQTAQLLLDLGASIESADSLHPLCISALMGEKPLEALEFLRQKGIPLRGIDDSGSSFHELVWERLSFEQALSFWQQSEPSDRRRDPRSLYGPLERAARSEIDPERKLQWLLTEGQLTPALIDPQKPWDDVNQRERMHSFTSHGQRRLVELGPLWQTRQDPSSTLRPAAPSATDDLSWDDGLSSSSRDDDEPAPRPSLLAYCASRGALRPLLFLLERDRLVPTFTDPDYALAWREAIEQDAPLSVLQPLASALRSRSLPLWGRTDRLLALRHLGAQKTKQLGLSHDNLGLSVEQGFREGLASAIFNNHAYPAYGRGRSSLAWVAAAQSPHPSSSLSILSPGMPFPGLAFGLLSLSLLHYQKDAKARDRLSKLISLLPSLAEQAPEGSPWRLHPQDPMAHLDDQIIFESALALPLAPAKDESLVRRVRSRSSDLNAEHAFGGSLSVALLEMAFRHDKASSAKLLLDQGLRAPSPDRARELASGAELDLHRAFTLFQQRVQQACGLNAEPQALSALRDFSETLVSRPDWMRLWNSSPYALLGGIPDSAIFTEIFEAGAPLASPNGSKSAIAFLTSQFPGRLSPAFSERLASLAVSHGEPLADYGALSLALSFAKVHPSAGLKQASATAVERFERALAMATPADWAAFDQAHSQDAYASIVDPASVAISSGNFNLVDSIFRVAPESHLRRVAPSLPLAWLDRHQSQLQRSLSLLGESALSLSSSPSETLVSISSDEDSLSCDIDFSASDSSNPREQQAFKDLVELKTQFHALLSRSREFGLEPRHEGSLLFKACGQLDSWYHTVSFSVPFWLISQGINPASTAPMDSDILGRSMHAELQTILEHACPDGVDLDAFQASARIPFSAAFRFEKTPTKAASLYLSWRAQGHPTVIETSPALPEPLDTLNLLDAQARAMVETALLNQISTPAVSGSKPRPRL